MKNKVECGSESGVDHSCDRNDCSDDKCCDQSGLEAFVSDVTKLVLGTCPEDGAINQALVLAELTLLIERSQKLQLENTDLKTQIGVANTNVDRIQTELIQSRQKSLSGSDVVVRASKALSKMQAAYGDDLNWENVVERTTGALVRLQSQAPLMQAAEAELERMRGRLAELERMRACEANPGVREHEDAPPFGAPSVSRTNIGADARLDALENDLAFVRLLSKVGSRFLGLDRLSGKS